MFEERANQRHGIKAMPLVTLRRLVFHMLLFRKSKSLQLFDDWGVPPRRLVLVDFLDASSPERRDLRFKVLPCGRDTRISKFHVQSRSCHEPVWPPNAACGV